MAVTSNTHLYRRGGIDELKKKNFCFRFISPWWYSRTFEINAMAIKSRFYGSTCILNIEKKNSKIEKEISISIKLDV